MARDRQALRLDHHHGMMMRLDGMLADGKMSIGLRSRLLTDQFGAEHHHVRGRRDIADRSRSVHSL